jgi:hypothetical protein
MFDETVIGAGAVGSTTRDDVAVMSARATISGYPFIPGSVAGQAPSTVIDAICEEASRICEQQFGSDLRALILTGSFARGEGSFIRLNEVWYALSDAEFMVVLADSAGLPSTTEQQEFHKNINHALECRGLDCATSWGLVHAGFLRGLQPSIFAFELRACGRVLSGDASVLSLAQPFETSKIPLEDAWRLLSNRLVESLEILGCLEDDGESVLPQLSYRIIKLYLDMCTSLLVFCGAYQPRYSQRAYALGQLALSEPGDLPFSLSGFSKQVSAATEFKISGKNSESLSAANKKALAAVTAEAMGYARKLWRWELKKLTVSDDDPDDQQLLKRWMSRQAMGQRIRGWAYVCRKQGWHRSWREWGRWLRLLCQASPRYLIYAVATEMCFLLPSWLDSPRAVDVRSWGDSLPVCGKIAGSDSSQWPALAAAALWNYHQFVSETLA